MRLTTGPDSSALSVAVVVSVDVLSPVLVVELVVLELSVTVVVATHDPDVASRADRIVHIVDGRITRSPREVVAEELVEVR